MLESIKINHPQHNAQGGQHQQLVLTLNTAILAFSLQIHHGRIFEELAIAVEEFQAALYDLFPFLDN
jgi:hypothetical protein